MEILKIDETSQAAVNESVGLHKFQGKGCIYYPERPCSAPKLQFKICRGCPRAAQFIQNNIIRSVFDHVKSMAISLLEGMNFQLSK